MKEILACRNIDFKYNKESILNNINFSVFQGDFIVFIGPNGGGKSTLAKILLGLLKPTKGSLDYPNKSIFNKNSLIGYTPQDTNINQDFPIQVLDVVLMGFLEKKNFGYKITEKNKLEALEIMQKLGIENLKQCRISELSGGQKQRVMIARALCGKPQLLIFDEPTSNIDMPTQQEIYTLLKQININHTIILISHDVSILSQCANKVFFINKQLIDYKNLNYKIEIERLNHKLF